MDYEGKYFPDEQSCEEAPPSRFTKIIKGIFKYTFWGICLLVWGVVMFRIFTSSDASLIEDVILSNGAKELAVELKDEFNVYSVQTASTMNFDGSIQIKNNAYAEDAKEFEIGLRYRMKHYTGEKDTAVPFTFKLVDQNKKEHAICNTVFDTKNDYGFARISFEGVEIDRSTNNYYYADGDYSKYLEEDVSPETPDINDETGEVLNTEYNLFLYVYYGDNEVAKLQVYHDFAILKEIDYDAGN